MLRSHKFFSSSYHLSPEEYNIWKHIKAKHSRFTEDMKYQDVYDHYLIVLATFSKNCRVNFRQLLREEIKDVCFVLYNC